MEYVELTQQLSLNGLEEEDDLEKFATSNEVAINKSCDKHVFQTG